MGTEDWSPNKILQDAGAVRASCFNHSGSFLAYGGDAGDIIVVRRDGWTNHFHANGSTRAMSFCVTNDLFAYGAHSDKKLRIVHTSDWKPAHELIATDWIESVCFGMRG